MTCGYKFLSVVTKQPVYNSPALVNSIIAM